MFEQMKPVVYAGSSDEHRLQFDHAGWTTSFLVGDLRAARDHALVGMSIYDADRHHHSTSRYGGHDAGVCARAHAGLIESLRGDLDAGHRHGIDAIRLAERLGHQNSLTIAHACEALRRFFVRDLDGARQFAASTLDLAKKFGPLHMEILAQCVGAWSAAMMEEAGDVDHVLRSGIDASLAYGAVVRIPHYQLMLAEVQIQRGAYEDAWRAVESAFDIMNRYRASLLHGEALRLRGEVEMRISQPLKAARSFEAAVAHARDQGARLLELRATVSNARLAASNAIVPATETSIRMLLDSIVSAQGARDVIEARALLSSGSF